MLSDWKNAGLLHGLDLLGAPRRAVRSPSVTARALSALLKSAANFPLTNGLRPATDRVRIWVGGLDEVPIWVKALAASSILLLCLIGIGTNAYVTLDRSARGIAQLSHVELPKQGAVAALTDDIITTHLKIFRYVSWAQIGLGGNTLTAARGPRGTRQSRSSAQASRCATRAVTRRKSADDDIAYQLGKVRPRNARRRGGSSHGCSHGIDAVGRHGRRVPQHCCRTSGHFGSGRRANNTDEPEFCERRRDQPKHTCARRRAWCAHQPARHGVCRSLHRCSNPLDYAGHARSFLRRIEASNWAFGTAKTR